MQYVCCKAKKIKNKKSGPCQSNLKESAYFLFLFSATAVSSSFRVYCIMGHKQHTKKNKNKETFFFFFDTVTEFSECTSFHHFLV